jgi:hypothetical protein
MWDGSTFHRTRNRNSSSEDHLKKDDEKSLSGLTG